MRKLLIVLAAVALGLFAAASAQPANAGALPAPPVLSCPDVNGSGAVGGPDIAGFVLRFGTNPVTTPDDYLALFDVNGSGQVSGPDIATTVLAFGDTCPFIDTQVAQATIAMAQYNDCQAGVADGYTPGSGGIYVPQMGIHLSKLANMSREFDLETPFGLVCTETSPGSGVPDKLIGAWYIFPVAETCAVYGVAGPCQNSSVQPVGFGTTNLDEDNLDPDGDGRQSGWHTHINLCVGPSLLLELGPIENAHEVCKNSGGSFVVPVYG